MDIYLDHNATTPVDPGVVETVTRHLTDRFGNAASTHPRGRAASEAVERARFEVASLLGVMPRRVVWTSGATEALNTALTGLAESRPTRRDRLLVGATEHEAVLGLAERHPDLFGRVRTIEKEFLAEAGITGDKSYDDYGMVGRQYTWSQGETLDELLARRDEILERHREAIDRAKARQRDLPLVDALAEALDEDDDTMACAVCAL